MAMHGRMRIFSAVFTVGYAVTAVVVPTYTAWTLWHWQARRPRARPRAWGARGGCVGGA